MASYEEGATSRRLKWTIPKSDTSTQAWVEQQDSVSRSLQTLVRESIQRDGYVDVVNRPVEQLPRRGRPPSTPGGWVENAAADAGQPAMAPEGQLDMERETTPEETPSVQTDDESSAPPATAVAADDEAAGQPSPGEPSTRTTAATGIEQMLDMR